MKLVKHADGKGGYIFLPTYCPENITDMIASDFSVRDDDLFIVTYPKSGTTWTQRITLLLINNGEEEDRILIDVMPWLEGEAWFHKAKNMDSPRYIKSHLPYALIPRVSNSRAKYIYLATPRIAWCRVLKFKPQYLLRYLGGLPFALYEGRGSFWGLVHTCVGLVQSQSEFREYSVHKI